MKIEYGKIFIERDGKRFEFVNYPPKYVKFEKDKKSDNPYKPLTGMGRMKVKLNWSFIRREILWAKVLYLSSIIANQIFMEKLGILID
ncbi:MULTISPECIES: hypothetical protein [unclassified Clostridioides]|uniref:hypothetical protein n=1 Tax=unclassified Clostridioides TaxID=2635829 RepID=UPI001D0C2BB7|nr:hypothetical protein [Clostridioides sp. ES-S-0001-03]MCC0670467.1 hypothetical protein [Clostridioides sp. ES-S-0145-01]